MEISSEVEQLLDSIVSRVADLFDGDISTSDEVQDDREAPSCSNNLTSEGGASEIASKSDDDSDDESADGEKSGGKVHRKGARLGMGFLLAQLRSGTSEETPPTKIVGERVHSEIQKGALKRTVDENYECLPKKQRLEVNFNFEKATEIFRDKDSFLSKAPEFGFRLGNDENNYIKCCKWSASGLYIATSSQDRKARIFELEEKELRVKHSMSLGGLIYDMCWHPSVNCLATSSKDHPIHLWRENGQRAATFRGINQLDELDSAQSLCFSLDGLRLYAGYNRCIRVYDMYKPGRQQREVKTWEKGSGGQKSWISCIAMNPAINGLYAAASYGKSVALYSDISPSAECIFDTPSNAVTHLRYSSDGNLLFTAGRKENVITCWDLRRPGHILSVLQRPSTTNQRIYFEIDDSGRYLFSGSSSGELLVFDLLRLSSEPVHPIHSFPVCRSALTGISVHSSQAMVAVCSGQRVFPFPSMDGEDHDEVGGNEYEAVGSSEALDNVLALWAFRST